MDWIFSHIDDLDAEAAMDISEGRSAADSISESIPVGPKVRDGPGSECPQETGRAGADPHSLKSRPGCELLDASALTVSSPPPPSLEYQLFAFISHMGTSTMCGHYVCHVKKEGR